MTKLEEIVQMLEASYPLRSYATDSKDWGELTATGILLSLKEPNNGMIAAMEKAAIEGKNQWQAVIDYILEGKE